MPGNRVILIGDSVMASTSQRYGGEMCAALVPLGWQTEVDAETGRFIDFGDEVLDSRLAAGWDVSVILLGNNYGDNQDVYREYLDAMVARLSPQPVVLLTVTEFKPSRAQVNAVIFEMAQKYPNVVVLDWAAVTAADRRSPGDDGLHLAQAGREALAEQVALGARPRARAARQVPCHALPRRLQRPGRAAPPRRSRRTPPSRRRPWPAPGTTTPKTTVATGRPRRRRRTAGNHPAGCTTAGDAASSPTPTPGPATVASG